jgi:transketolase
MRGLPNMTVIVPADVDEAYKAALATLDIDGPVYLRLGGRVDEPPVTDPDKPFVLGKATQLRPGNDVAVIATGCMVEMAVRAADALAADGIRARVLNMHTIKPLDREAILAAAAETRGIVTAEEHHLTGGLGGAVAELLAVEHPTRMRLVGMPDEFAVVGPTVPLRAKYGMSAEAIEAACRDLLK